MRRDPRYQDLARPPVDRLLFASDLVQIGAFRAPVDHPRFRTLGRIRRHLFVFPRTGVVIHHEGGTAFCTDTRTVTFYNAGQRYRRRPLDPRGDLCDWFTVRPDVLMDVLARYDPGVRRRPRRPLPFSHGPSDAQLYLVQRALVRYLIEDGRSNGAHQPSDGIQPSGAETPAADERLLIEETTLRLLDAVAGLAYAANAPRSKRGGVPRRRRPAVDGERSPSTVTRLRAMLACRFADSLGLDDMARHVGLSVFHLCRLFRRSTGTTIARYRQQLRLRRSLELVAEPGSDLTDVALELGYSSHSHFTAAFRRTFSITPSAFRGCASCSKIRELAAGLTGTRR